MSPYTDPSSSAFSCVSYGPAGESYHQEGLTKREYFAAALMAGMLAGLTKITTNPDEVVKSEDIAKVAVGAADKLIVVLNEGAV